MADKDKIFVVRIADDGKANPDSLTVSYGNRQRIVWVSDAAADREIQFDKDSAFGGVRTFDLPKQGYCDPGPITIKKEDTYHYSVALKGATSGAAADPTIIITGWTST